MAAARAEVAYGVAAVHEDFPRCRAPWRDPDRYASRAARSHEGPAGRSSPPSSPPTPPVTRAPVTSPLLSRRTTWERRESPLASALALARASGRALVDLTEANPTRVGLAYPWDEIAAAYARAAREPYEPEPLGLLTARAAVAERYAPGVDPARVLLTASTSEAYAHLFRLLADPGDRVLVPRPSYPLFGLLADLEGVELASYRLDPHDGWRPDWDSLDAALAERPVRAVITVSPNNPTGSSLDGGALAALAERARVHGFALIADEVFCDFRRDGVALVDAARDGLLDDVTWFALGGLSKSAGLPGAKLAWTACGASETVLGEVLARLDVIADTFLSPAMVVQVALPALLELAPRIRAAIRERLDVNVAALASLVGTPAGAWPVMGGWSVVLRVPAIHGDEEWARRLVVERGVVVQPGSFFELEAEGQLVASLLPEPAPFRAGLAALAELAAG